jgi:hypothetical protein
MELILFALPAVKFDQGYPHVLATNAFFKKWSFGVDEKVWRPIEVLIESATDICSSRLFVLNERGLALLIVRLRERAQAKKQ